MTNFDQLQALWHQQPSPGEPPAAEAILVKAQQSHRQMRATHLGTIVILTVTVLVLAGYFWLYDMTTSSPALLGSGLMMVSLLLRIGVEYGSYCLFRGIKRHADLRTCLEQTRSFLRVRKGIQWGVTPLSLGSYVGGFILLLPYVRAEVSGGFYGYIILSGLLSLVVISVIIYRQIRRELHLLAQLKESYTILLTE